MTEETKATPHTKKLKDLTDRVNHLEAVLCKMAHFNGNNRLILEAGLTPWEPGKKDMTKYKD